MGPVYKLSVGAMCDEKDEEEIGYLLKKEVKLLVEREGIGLF